MERRAPWRTKPSMPLHHPWVFLSIWHLSCLLPFGGSVLHADTRAICNLPTLAKPLCPPCKPQAAGRDHQLRGHWLGTDWHVKVDSLWFKEPCMLCQIDTAGLFRWCSGTLQLFSFCVWSFSRGNALVEGGISQAQLPGPGDTRQEATRDTLPFASSEKWHWDVSNWAPKVNGNFWPSLLCASFPHLYRLPPLAECEMGSVVTVEPVCDGERAGQERKHCAGSTAASETFLRQVCASLLRDEDEKKHWVATCALHEIQNLWLLMMQTLTDAHRKDNLQSCKKANAWHLSPSVFSTNFFWNICIWVFISPGTLSYMYPADRRPWLCSSCMQSKVITTCSVFGFLKIR